MSSSEDAEDDIDYGKINIKKIIKEGVAEDFDENALRKYQLERLKYVRLLYIPEVSENIFSLYLLFCNLATDITMR